MNTPPCTKVSCEVLVRKDDRLLLGKRNQNIYGGGLWALPGGHLEYNERLIEAICREIKEELGATVPPAQLRAGQRCRWHSRGQHALCALHLRVAGTGF